MARQSPVMFGFFGMKVPHDLLDRYRKLNHCDRRTLLLQIRRLIVLFLDTKRVY